jgi:hypothetical protein
MNFLQRLASGFKPEESAPTKKGLPMKRVSLPSDSADLMNIAKTSGPVPFVNPKKFPVEIYEILGYLTMFNPDLRQAVKHVVELGNTGHLLTVEADTESAIDAVVDRVEMQSNRIYPFAAGVDGLVNAYFSQIIRFGATSSEWVPNNTLTGVDRVFMVPVRTIRWILRKDLMGYDPVQKPENQIVYDPENFIKLNPRTYHYMNLETDEDSPYAVPPFLAAIGPVAIQKMMTDNIRKIIKKLGIMGVATYAVDPPAQRPGESDTDYNIKCLAYLDQMATQLQGTFSEGLAIGFKGAFDFDVTSVTGDARGVSEIFNLNEQQLFSAIGSDPAMHGRTYQTTETYASVMYSKMISQLRNTQLIVAHSLQFGFGLDLMLAGIPAKGLNIAFRPSQALNNLQESQAEMIDIANASALYNEGIIGQDEKAHRLGYQKADQDEPRPDPSLAQDKNLTQRPNTGGGSDNKEKASSTTKKQPKESQKVVFELTGTGRYKHVVDMNYLDLKGKTLPVTLAEEPKEPVPDDNHFRRYLRRDHRDAGCC